MLRYNFNGAVWHETPAEFLQFSRGFFYADSLFETIRVFSGQIPFLEKHLARLFAGMEMLGFETPEGWGGEFFEKEILKVSPENARARLTVFRKPGGKFLPKNASPSFLIFAENCTVPIFPHQIFKPIKLGVSGKVVLAADKFSNFKTLNSPRYVAAAIEAQQLGCDDVLLPNQFGRVAEATSSNVFLIKGKTLATPSLSEACVAGTMRRTLLELGPKVSFKVKEKPITFAELEKADEVFLSNAIRGIVPVGEFRGEDFSFEKTRKLQNALDSHLEGLLSAKIKSQNGK